MNKGFNFQFKHLVYLLISGMILGTGYILGDKIVYKTSAFISKPYVNETRLNKSNEKIYLLEKKLNANTARTNELYEYQDSMVTIADFKEFEETVIKTIKSEIQNNLTNN